MGCITFGSEERILVPLPAARIMAATDWESIWVWLMALDGNTMPHASDRRQVTKSCRVLQPAGRREPPFLDLIFKQTYYGHRRARSSVVEHYVHIVGVVGSIPSAPTTFSQCNQLLREPALRAFFLLSQFLSQETQKTWPLSASEARNGRSK